MKVFHKIAAFLLMFVFISETFGVSRYAHFCGGEVTSESYFIEKKDCCCEESDEEDMGDCCKDEIKIVQLKEVEAIPVLKSTDLPKLTFVNLFISLNSNSIFNSFSFNKSSIKIESHLSIDDGTPPIRELVCCYLI